MRSQREVWEERRMRSRVPTRERKREVRVAVE
jgi:hypothetical protein